MGKNKLLKPLFIICVACAALSCNDGVAFHTYKDMPNFWHKDSAVVFKINEKDTVNTYNLFLTLRNDGSYKYSNLFLITEMQFPHGRTISDTLEYTMSEPDGSWLGTGFGDLKDNKLWYREGVRFEERGMYIFSVRQAMRRNGDVDPIVALEGIRDVGLRIEKTKQ